MESMILTLMRWFEGMYCWIDSQLPNGSITPERTYLFVGLFSIMMILSGNMLSVVGLPWLALAAYRYIYK